MPLSAAELERFVRQRPRYFRKLARPTHKKHDLLLRKWARFAQFVDRPVHPVNDLTLFAAYLGDHTRGRLGNRPTRKTVVDQLLSFRPALARQDAPSTPHPTSKDVRQAIAFACSEDYLSQIPLVTAMRPKPVGTPDDLKFFAHHIWTTTTSPWTRLYRERVQFVYLLAIAVLTSSRPGELVESAAYRHSGESLIWGDHEFLARDDGQIALQLTVRLLKGHRCNDSKYKRFLLLPALETPLICPVTLALTLAFMDGILENIRTVDDLCGATSFTIREESKGLAPWRAICFVDKQWTVTDSPLTHASYSYRVHACARELGIPGSISPYAWRRGTANHLDRTVNRETRNLWMGHAEASSEFALSYQSRTIAEDVTALILGQQQDRAAIVHMIGLCSQRQAVTPSLPSTLSELQEPQSSIFPALKAILAFTHGAAHKMFHCLGCSKAVHSIARHSTNATTSKCRLGRYRATDTNMVLVWDHNQSVGIPEVKEKPLPRYRCMGCSNPVVDMRAHASKPLRNQKCKQGRFKVRNESGSFGPQIHCLPLD